MAVFQSLNHITYYLKLFLLIDYISGRKKTDDESYVTCYAFLVLITMFYAFKSVPNKCKFYSVVRLSQISTRPWQGLRS